MNKLLNTFLAFLFTFTLASSVWAFQVPPQPEKCPSVDSIQKTAFITAKKLLDGSYAAVQLGNYDSSQMWAFIIAQITATSVPDAMSKATAVLGSLSFASGPNYYAENNIWACIYNVSSGYQAVALTPLPSSALNTDSMFKAAKFQ